MPNWARSEYRNQLALIPTSPVITLLCLGSGLGAARLAQITRSTVLRGVFAVLAFLLLILGCAGAIRLISPGG